MLLREFWGSLSDAPELSELLGKLCEEKASTEELASRTGMTVADVRRARRRLARRIESFAKRKGLGTTPRLVRRRLGENNFSSGD
jgi:hypothetical protein